MKDHEQCSLAGKFSLWEKIYALSSFAAMGKLGTIGIILEDWIWVLPYVLIYWYGVPGIIQRHLVCPRCPHLYEYNDCLQFPVFLTRWVIKKQKTGPFSSFEKILFLSIFILIPSYPLYWLSANITLLMAFLISAVMWYAGQLFYFCKRCRVKECPFNRASITVLNAPEF